MALIVEDGTGLATADSYNSLAELTAYHAARGNADWAAGAEADQEAAAREAAAFLDDVCRGWWKGVKASGTQALAWPRVNVLDEDGYGVTGLPTEVKAAHAEASLRALAGDLTPDLARGGRIKRKSIAGAIETEYMDDAPAGTIYPEIARKLAGLLRSAFTVELVRT
ncbi:MAG: hypothetical protein KQJ78_07685 [Deltaproteobacteria bacterium]|nr:hypothetical protein [Deltaproteobacteria bacterium]